MTKGAVHILRAGCVLAALVLFAAPADAQACLGRPIGGLAGHAVLAQTAYSAYHLEDRIDGADLGAVYWGNPRGFAAYSAGYTRRFMSGGGPDLDVLHALVAAELPRLAPLPPGSGACLTLSGSGTWIDDQPGGTDLAAYAVPVGLAVGLTVPAGRTSRVYPYLHPQILLARADGEAFGFEVSERYTALVVEGGMGFARGPLVGRATILVGARADGAGIGPVPDLRAGIEAGIRF